MVKTAYIRNGQGALVVPAELVLRAQKPYFNGYVCGHGAHGDRKYNRSRAKRSWARSLDGWSA